LEIDYKGITIPDKFVVAMDWIMRKNTEISRMCACWIRLFIRTKKIWTKKYTKVSCVFNTVMLI